MVYASFRSTNQQIYHGSDFPASLSDISLGISGVPNWKRQENRDSRGLQPNSYCMGDITLGVCFFDKRSIQHRTYGVQENHVIWSKKVNLWPRYGSPIYHRYHHKGKVVNL